MKYQWSEEGPEERDEPIPNIVYIICDFFIGWNGIGDSFLSSTQYKLEIVKSRIIFVMSPSHGSVDRICVRFRGRCSILQDSSDPFVRIRSFETISMRCAA